MTDLAKIPYTNRDYESIRRALIERIPLITDRWTDLNESDLGMTLLELFCGVGDMLAFYLDKQANENYLPTVKQRTNAINLLKLIGYRLSNPVPAQTRLRFTIDSPRTDDVVIPAWTVAKTASSTDGLPFVLPEPATNASGSTEVIANAIQGRRYADTFTGTGAIDQRFALRKGPVAQSMPKDIRCGPQALSMVEVTVDGEPWTEVATWYDSDSASRHFMVETDGDGATSIVFGDGFFGAVPVAGASITVQYLVTQGSKGNVRKGLVTVLEGSITSGGEVVPATVTNIDQATGGVDREPISRARKLGPASLRSTWKLVTKEDYEAEILANFPSVETVEVLDCNDCVNIPYLRVYLLVHPTGGGPLSAILREQLTAFVEDRKVLGTEVAIYDQSSAPMLVMESVS